MGASILLGGLTIPVLKDVVDGLIDYETSLLVEFEPDSIWYETSLTIAACSARRVTWSIVYTIVILRGRTCNMHA